MEKKPDGRKERVLHTRIPAWLEDELKRVAEGLRVPASNLVRQILEDSLQFVGQASAPRGLTTASAKKKAEALVDRVSSSRMHVSERWAHYRTLFERLGRVVPEAAGNKTTDPWAWQPVIVATELECGECGASLPAGGEGYLGLSDGSVARQIRCGSCISTVASGRFPRGSGARRRNPNKKRKRASKGKSS